MLPLIIALDYPTKQKAQSFLAQIDPDLCYLKVGSELFTASGSSFIKELVQQGFRVFLDLKFHDIPNTVAAACRSAADLGVWMINVHASGGSRMLNAARESLVDYGIERPLLIAVTVLTSMSERDFLEISSSYSLEQQVLSLANLSYRCGLDGVVCSAQEAKSIKSRTCDNFITVTPGIRLETGAIVDDQSRVATPIEAVHNGADYLVMGRPITQAANPKSVINALRQELSS